MMHDQPLMLTDNPDVEEIVQEDEELDQKGDFKVIIHNDDTTPMDFVLYILLDVFKRPHIMAEAIMWEAHEQGNAIVGAWSKKVAEMKVRQAHFRARLKGFPLLFTIEQD
jgi:ATP-dependent Clp protease adaptor protein ClpS